MADRGIFVKVLASLESASFLTAVERLKSQASDAGLEVSKSWDTAAATSSKAGDAIVKSEAAVQAATEKRIDTEEALQRAKLKTEEVVKTLSERELSAQREVELAALNTAKVQAGLHDTRIQQLKEEAAAVLTAAEKEQDAAKQTAALEISYAKEALAAKLKAQDEYNTAAAASRAKAAEASTAVSDLPLVGSIAAEESARRNATKAAEGQTAAIAAHNDAITKAADSQVTASQRGLVALNAWGKGAALSLAVIGGASVDVAAKVEQNMNRIVTMHQETANTVGQMTSQIYELATQVPFSVQKLSEGLQLIEQHGYRGQDAMNVLSTSAKTALSTSADLGDTIGGLTTQLDDMGYQGKKGPELLQDMNTMAGQLVVTMKDLKNLDPAEYFRALHSVEPSAKAYMTGLPGNQASSQVSAAMDALSQTGMSQEQSAPNLARLISTLGAVRPGSTTFNTLGQLGLKQEDIAQEMQKQGFLPVIQTIQNAIAGKTNKDTGLVDIGWKYNNEQVSGLIDQTIGSLSGPGKAFLDAHPEIQKGLGKQNVLKGALGKSGIGADEAQSILTLSQWEQMTHGPQNFIKKGGTADVTPGQVAQLLYGTGDVARTGLILGQNPQGNINAANDITKGGTPQALQDAFNQAMTSTTNQWKELGSTTGALAGRIGNDLLPVIKSVIDGFKSMLDFFAEYPVVGSSLLKAMVILAGTAGFVKLVKGIDSMMEAFGVFRGWLVGNKMATGLSELAGGATAAGAEMKAGTATLAAEEATAGRTLEEGAATTSAGLKAGAATLSAEEAAAGRTLEAGAATASAEMKASAGAGGLMSKLGGAGGGLMAALAGAPFLAAGALSTGGDWLARNGDKLMGTNILEKYGEIPGSGLWFAHQFGNLFSTDDPAKPDDGKDQSTVDEVNRRLAASGVGADSPSRAAATALPPDGPVSDTTDPNASIGPTGDGGPTATGPNVKSSAKYHPIDLNPADKPGNFTTYDEWITAQKEVQSALNHVDDTATTLAAANAKMAELQKKGTASQEAWNSASDAQVKALRDNQDAVQNATIAQQKLGEGKGKAAKNSWDDYDPFSEAGSGGFTLPNLARVLATYAANEALGNPYGKLQAGKLGSSPGNPMYVQDINGNIVPGANSGITQNADGSYSTTAGSGTFGAGSLVAPKGGAKGWKDTVAQTVAKYGPAAGIDPKNYGAWTDAIVSQIGIESGGDPNIRNDHDSDGHGGTQSVAGLLQYLPSTFASSAAKLTGSNNMMDPVAQIAGALMAPRNAAGLPAHLGQGGGWGPDFGTPINPAAVAQSAPSATSGGGGGGGGSILQNLLSQFLPGAGPGSTGPVFKRSPAPPGPYDNSPGAVAAREAADPAFQHLIGHDVDQNGKPRAGPGGTGGGMQVVPGPQNPTNYRTTSPIGSIPAGGPPNQIGPFPVPGPGPATGPRGVTQPGVGNGAGMFRPTPGGGGLGGPANAPIKQTQLGANNPNPSPGAGVGGGGSLLGMAESAAATALNAIAPGAGVAAQIATQEANRFAGYLGQLGGIGAEGLLETFSLSGENFDPSQTLAGKAITGIAGAHPSGPNVAGKTAPPMKPQDDKKGQKDGDQGNSQSGVNIGTQNFYGDAKTQADAAMKSQNQAQLMYSTQQ